MPKTATNSKKIDAEPSVWLVAGAAITSLLGMALIVADVFWLALQANYFAPVAGVTLSLIGLLLFIKAIIEARHYANVQAQQRDNINARRLRERSRNIARIRRVKQVAATTAADARARQQTAEKQLLLMQAKSKQLLDKLKSLKQAYDESNQRYRYARSALDEKQLKLDESSRALTILGNRINTQKEQLSALEKAGKEFKKVVSSTADQNVNLEILLSRIIPRPIVKLLDGKMPSDASVGKLARQVDNVNILFADIVNYTANTEHKPPKQLLEELHELFTMFDERAQHYEVEKIKTIGDCYMAATGLFSRDHEAEKLIRFAESINNKIASSGKWQLSIGIASGPVIAGIIGREKLVYDIWGHAVNLAARLQSTAKAEQILVSQRFRSQLLNNKKYQFNAVEIPQLKGIRANVTAYELIVNH